MSNNFHRLYGYPKDIGLHGIQHYLNLSIENMKCPCCSKDCKCKDKPKAEEPKPEDDKCNTEGLDKYINNDTSVKPEEPTPEEPNTEELCTDECIKPNTIDNILKTFTDLNKDLSCTITP